MNRHSNNRSVVERTTFAWAGRDCAVIGYDVGHRCGYVDIPEGHPFFGKPADSPIFRTLHIHGGITFSEMDDEQWLIGFDCRHAGDRPDLSLVPADQPELAELFARMHPNGIVRTKPWVVAQTKRLAEQVAVWSQVADVLGPPNMERF